MYLVKTPLLISKLSSKALIWKIQTQEKKIYLTFDDGPIPELTEDILEILNTYQAKATFFCVGENAERYPYLMKLIKDDGHLIGNHSHQHIKGWKTNNDDYIDNVQKASEFTSSTLFRPPYGQISYRQIKQLKNNYKIIMWSVLSGDFDLNISPKKCLNNALQSKAGDIVVFHDNLKSKEKIAFALPKFLQHFSNLGYQFCDLSVLA